MVKININDKQFAIPQRLTINQYNSLLSFDWEDPKYYPMIVSQLINAPLPLLAKADPKSLALGIVFAVKAMNERKEVEMLNLDEITFGEFIDLDVYLTIGIEKHFKDIAKILCPKAKFSDEVMWAIEKYVAFRTFTYRQYKILFGITDNDIYDAEPDEIKKTQIAKSWYNIIVNIAKENILYIDRVTEQPLKKALNFMALQKEKAVEENLKKQQQQRRYDLQRNSR
jgi:hypothetical protein